ncbi:MAG: Rpn family recombination-promoting nuclease/putative transposase [Candidatus Gastranaerophilales bacterium]|nr:Rpn family recombination-promoting nuclease/putative transposase [Candidatus Gastranaerophilales bacterium]
MGKYDDALYMYLSDNDRFADLFNAVLFQGERVLRADMLEPDSERYVDNRGIAPKGKKGKRLPAMTNSFRDIKKRLKTGESFVVTAIENQQDVDYSMPWRIMNYDCLEYGRQIKEIQKSKQAARKAEGMSASHWAERLEKGDLLHPVYTICFYHGTESWDGPRSLKDMMRYEDRRGVWQGCFQDYGMRLFCANEAKGLENFQTELKQLLMVLPLREDKNALSALWNREEFSHLERDTVETMAVMTDNTEMLDRLAEYKEEEGYSMCKAMEELKRDWKEEGIAEGISEGMKRGIEQGIEQGITQGILQGIVLTIDNFMQKLPCSLEKACEIAGKTPEEYHRIKQMLNHA